jgi:hypothetical protein
MADSPLVNRDLVRQLVLAAALVIFVGAVITGTWLTAIAMVFTAIGMASSLWSTRTGQRQADRMSDDRPR